MGFIVYTDPSFLPPLHFYSMFKRGNIEVWGTKSAKVAVSENKIVVSSTIFYSDTLFKTTELSPITDESFAYSPQVVIESDLITTIRVNAPVFFRISPFGIVLSSVKLPDLEELPPFMNIVHKAQHNRTTFYPVRSQLDYSRAIILLSGGIDSNVSLHLTKDKFKITALHFPLDKREHQRVKRICSELNIPLIEMNVPNLFMNYKPSKYSPARNIVFVSIALSLCEREGIGNIITGFRGVYPSDQSPEFSYLMQKIALYSTRKGAIRIINPVQNLEREEVYAIARTIGLKYKELSMDTEIVSRSKYINPRNIRV